MPIVKTNGKICICGDYRATVNTATKTDQYPIPRIEDIYSTLNGGQEFSKIDCSNAYLQYRLHVDYRKYTTINTTIGLLHPQSTWALLLTEHLATALTSRKVKAKTAARNNVLRKLANSKWGTHPSTIKTTALALCYSTAEYACPVCEG